MSPALAATRVPRPCFHASAVHDGHMALVQCDHYLLHGALLGGTRRILAAVATPRASTSRRRRVRVTAGICNPREDRPTRTGRLQLAAADSLRPERKCMGRSG